MAAQPPQQPPQPQITIAEPSVKSLLLQMRFNGQVLGTGTGFVANAPRGPVLVTNRHNVTGRNQETGQPLSPTGGVPNEVVIMHNRANLLGQWVARTEPLHGNNGQPLWIEHAGLGARADFVALPLTQLNDVQLYPYDLPPIFSTSLKLVKSAFEGRSGHEEAVHGRADHRLSEAGGSRGGDQGSVPEAWL